MALQDIVNAKEQLGKIERVASAYKNREAVDIAGSFIAYLGNENVAPEEQNMLYDLYDNHRSRFLRRVVQARNDETNSLVQKVEENYNPAVDHLSDEDLLNFALAVIPKRTGDERHDARAKLHEKYQTIAMAAERGNAKPYLEDLKERNEKYHKMFTEDFKPAELAGIAKAYSKRLEAVFKASFMQGEGDERTIDKAAIKDYLRTTLSAYNPDEKRMIYMHLASKVDGAEED